VLSFTSIITGPPMVFLSVVVVVCNTPWQACRRLQPHRPLRWHAASSLIIAPRLHSRPVMLHPIRATPGYTLVVGCREPICSILTTALYW